MRMATSRYGTRSFDLKPIGKPGGLWQRGAHLGGAGRKSATSALSRSSPFQLRIGPNSAAAASAQVFRARSGRDVINTEEFDVAVPRKKVSPMKRGNRRSADALKSPIYVEDKESGELRRPHHIDLKSGKYRGRQVLPPKEDI